MKTSLIIPIYNNKEYTEKCLNSIFNFGANSKFEIIVVNNGSIDGSAEYLSELNDKITVIQNDENLGFAKACNQGAKIAQGEYLLFLNNDTVVTRGWLDILVQEMDNNENIAIIGPKLLYPDGTVQSAGVVFDEEKWPHHIYTKEKGTELFVNKKREFQCLTAACFLIRKSIFNQFGGFDESYLNGLEDLDLCLKVRELGLGILYCPESVVYHYESVTEGRSNYDERNCQIFYSRWKDKIVVDYKKYLIEDEMKDMGNFLETFHGKKISFKKIKYLFQRFIITGKRDGWRRAMTKSFKRLVIKTPNK
jgi:O-antigen biosynthesis protein